MIDKRTLVILIAPNVGEQMGGEAIKALQIFRELKKIHPNIVQITHERNKTELSNRLQLSDVEYIADTNFALLLWHSRILRWLLNAWFCRSAVRLAEQIALRRGLKKGEVIVHQTEPNSPVMPRSISEIYLNVLGPINGNIYYPPIFRGAESLVARLRRIFHFPVQRFNKVFFRGITRVDAILVAGGSRTKRSLQTAGCPDDILLDSLDCGVADQILDRPRIKQNGTNLRFVHFGRLVFHKGTVLIIESLARTNSRICLDIIGRGPELERCRERVRELMLDDRVDFLDWFPSHSQLLDTFNKYRGVILPSMEDANGIVVQESMALGLPCTCLNWGGPQLLIENDVSGYLIEPISKEYVVEQLAHRLDKLASNPDLAEAMSIAAKDAAEKWRWSTLIQEWLAVYARKLVLPA